MSSDARQNLGDLYGRYAARLIALAAKQLPTNLRKRLDPEDVVQSAFGSFFRGLNEGRFSIPKDGDLWGLLAAIVFNKARSKRELNTAAKRDVTREEPLPDSAVVFDRKPTPDEAVMLADEVEYFLHGIRDPVHRRMVELRLQGLSIRQIADDVSRTEQRVGQVLRSLERQLEQRGRSREVQIASR